MHTPTSHSNTHPIHENTLWSITSKISELLESKACQQKSQELQDQLTRFQETLEAKGEKIQYDYSDYEQRLFRWEEEIEGIVQQDQDLRVLYENLLQAIKFAPYLKQSLWDKLLFDRLLELWPSAQEFSKPVTFSFAELKTNPEIPSSLKIKNLPSDASIQELEEVFLKIENAPWVLAIDLTDNNLWTFRKDQLQAIFSHLWNMKRINLWNNSLWELDESKLQAIFSHLWNVRSIYLSGNSLYKLDEPSLQVIFSYLENVRSVDFSWNNLWQLDKPRFQAIFSHLWNVRGMDLSWNNLWELDEPRLHVIFSHLSWARTIGLSSTYLWELDELRLQAIFSHLSWARTIGLSSTYLWELDELRLQAIFSHLWDVRTIDLSDNHLWELDEPRFQAIFSHLIHIEEVILKSQEEASKIESLFPNLIGKIKIQ